MQDIRANFTSPVARFAVSNLHPGSVYIVSIYAFNSKGRSDPAVLPAAMLRPAEKQLTSEKGKRKTKIITPSAYAVDSHQMLVHFKASNEKASGTQ